MAVFFGKPEWLSSKIIDQLKIISKVQLSDGNFSNVVYNKKLIYSYKSIFSGYYNFDIVVQRLEYQDWNNVNISSKYIYRSGIATGVEHVLDIISYHVDNGIVYFENDNSRLLLQKQNLVLPNDCSKEFGLKGLNSYQWEEVYKKINLMLLENV